MVTYQVMYNILPYHYNRYDIIWKTGIVTYLWAFNVLLFLERSRIHRNRKPKKREKDGDDNGYA